MSTIDSRSRRRAGFTLIEMLVVIAIIAILAALIVAGVMGAFGKGYEAQARSDILNLSQALDRFKADKKFYPPSELKLYSKASQYTNSALDVSSLTYISATWPNIIWNSNPNQAITWGGATAVPAGGFTLDCDQCLVFFLGGPPDGGGKAALLGGFSTNPQDPVYLGPYTAARKQLDRKSYFNFPANRLYLRVANNPFPSFQDAWPSQGAARPVSPYVYFSAGKIKDGYDPTQAVTFTIPVKGVNTPFTVAPYVQTLATPTTPTIYYNSYSFQLITAGLDGKFGPGGHWPPTSGVGNDDFSNFSGSQLGAGLTN